MYKKLFSLVPVVVVGVMAWLYFAYPEGFKNESKSEEFVRTFADKVCNAVIFRDWNEQYGYLSPDDQKRIEKNKFIEIQVSGEDSLIPNGCSMSSISIAGDGAKVRYLINVTNGLGNKADVPIQLDFKYINGKWYAPMPVGVEKWLSENGKDIK